MAATNSAFRTETRDEHLYNHIELFNRSSSPIDAPAANRCQDCRGQHPIENQIATGRRMFSDYRTEPSNEQLYYNIQSINKPSSPATESQGANQTSQDDRRRQQPTGNSKTMGRRVSSAMIAVLALAFLAMLASLIATAMVYVMKSGTNGCLDGGVLDDLKEQLNQVNTKITQLNENLVKEKKTEEHLPEKKIGNKTTYKGCQDVSILNDMRQQLKEVLGKNLNDTVSKIIDKVSSNQIDECRRLEKDSKDPWIKMTKSPIRFSVIDNQKDCCFIVPSGGTLAAVKLVHAYGYVACNDTHVTFWWGCGENNEGVNVEIKEATGEDIHSEKFSPEHTGSLRIPGYSPLSSELVLSYLSDRPRVIGRQKLCLSYSGVTNAGNSFFDVYARFE